MDELLPAENGLPEFGGSLGTSAPVDSPKPSAENDEALIAEAIRETGLLGCGCCVDSEAYDSDGCPPDEDGWTEHTFQGECVHEVGRVTYIARAVAQALATRVFPPGVQRDA